MNESLVDRVAAAVMYEGYILYPYRPSLKNRQRWTFGGVLPRGFVERQCGSDRWFTQIECLLAGGGDAQLEVDVRFLHLTTRTAGRLEVPRRAWPEDETPVYEAVESLRVGDDWYPSWQEAVERKVMLEPHRVDELVTAPQRERFAFGARRELEPLRPSAHAPIEGVLARDQQPVEGSVEVAVEPAGDELFRVRVTVRNDSGLDSSDRATREEALLRGLVSTHTILCVRGGEFVSSIAPPQRLRAAAEACENHGVWPVLVGEPNSRDAMLAAPIILYDYPQIAPESPGDFFDCTEIDELLSLRVQTLTEDEKHQMRSVDAQTRALLQRAEGMRPESMQGLHGTFREVRPLEEES